MARLNRVKEEDLSSALAALQLSIKKPASNPRDAAQTGNGPCCGNSDNSPVCGSHKTSTHQQRQQATPQRKALKGIRHKALGARHRQYPSEARQQCPSRSPSLLEVWRAAESPRGLRATDGTALSLDVEHTCIESLDESIGSLEDFIVDDSHVSYEDSASDPEDTTVECPGRAGFCSPKQPPGAREKILDALTRYREKREERRRQPRERQEASRRSSHSRYPFVGRASSSDNVPGVGEDVSARWYQPPDFTSESPSPDSRDDDSLRTLSLPPVVKYKTIAPKTELLTTTGQTNPHLDHNPGRSSSPTSSSSWSPRPFRRDKDESARLLVPGTTFSAEDNKSKTPIVLQRSISGQPSDELEARIIAALLGPTMASWQDGRLSFEQTKKDMATKFFSLLDGKISGGRIAAVTADVGGVPVLWNPRMTNAAGRMTWRRRPNINKRILVVELSPSILTNEERLKSTLAHEYCHVAAWIVDRDRSRRFHSGAFKKWGRLVYRHFGIEVTTYHNFPTPRRPRARYAWLCIDLGHVIQQHRPYFDPNRHLCPKCRSRIVQIRPPPENGPQPWVPLPCRDRRGRWLPKSHQPRHTIAEVATGPVATGPVAAEDEEEQKDPNITKGDMMPVVASRKRKRGSSRSRQRKRRSRHSRHTDEPSIKLSDSDCYE